MKKVKDWRFRVSNKEAIMGTVLALLNFVWWYAFAYGLGSQPVKEYTYILGFPAWFFYSCIAGFIVFTILVWIMVKFFFKEVPFETEEMEKEENH
ncbi:YhdT family protein [Fictibacillus nanhaiensis]|uniref:YhdT family protein n=1 Tax=Fictibacillus nanhaiensis TaxID=742169 RepID=UPI001C955B22|nr:YhdT family protein [Fictibacillus nanhaiensis]MBY6037261.1 YhdT family protein [Fictibacillus nanhaiensis]